LRYVKTYHFAVQCTRHMKSIKSRRSVWIQLCYVFAYLRRSVV